MNESTAKLVADLARLLCVELDLHYSDIQLAPGARNCCAF